jgi:phytoene synthase
MAGMSPSTAAHLVDDLAAVRGLLRTGSHSFHLASLLLPAQTRDAATTLYAYCRLADDAIDQGRDPASGLLQLQAQLDRIYGGRPKPVPVERLLTDVVHRYQIPRVMLDGLLEGFAWDVASRRYRTLAELMGYGARVAGTVGAMMTLLMGVRDPAVLARACDLGVAMQLTNIARDVGQDSRAGRVYLPLDWLEEAGIDADSLLAAPQFSSSLGVVIERLLRAADEQYARAVPGIAHLPPGARAGVHAARLLYAEIGQQVRRNHHDAITCRARVSAARKSGLLLLALGCSLRGSACVTALPLEEVRFLLASFPAGGLEQAAEAGARAPEQSRGEWLLSLFERLEQRDRVMRTGHASMGQPS